MHTHVFTRVSGPEGTTSVIPLVFEKVSHRVGTLDCLRLHWLASELRGTVFTAPHWDYKWAPPLTVDYMDTGPRPLVGEAGTLPTAESP